MIHPKDLTVNLLKKTDRNSFAHAIANSVIIDDFFKNAAQLAGDETYSRAIGDIFLNRFQIDSLMRFFTLNNQSVSSILMQNKHMTRDDLYKIEMHRRPFLIVNSVILRTTNKPPLPQRIHFETTPLYTGSKVLHKGAGSNKRDIGGGYIEPFGFDSDEPENSGKNGLVTVRLGTSKHRYTLSDVAGTSGAAPAEVLAKLGLDCLGFPEFKYWSPAKLNKQSVKEYNFGDGGILENLGIMPLLMRKVKKNHCICEYKSKIKRT